MSEVPHRLPVLLPAECTISMPFSTPTLNIASPTMTPIMGPGIPKFIFARGSNIRIIPLAVVMLMATVSERKMISSPSRRAIPWAALAAKPTRFRAMWMFNTGLYNQQQAL
jgi:hypothetical protein